MKYSNPNPRLHIDYLINQLCILKCLEGIRYTNKNSQIDFMDLQDEISVLIRLIYEKSGIKIGFSGYQ